MEAPKASRFCKTICGRPVEGSWSGSAFRSHPRGIFRENMIFTNEWSTYDYCSVKVATSKDAKLVLGCQNPAAHGDPHPTVSEGELVTVYRNGSWVAEGPWCERIVAILDEVDREIAEQVALEKSEREAAQAERQRMDSDRLSAAAAVFGS